MSVVVETVAPAASPSVRPLAAARDADRSRPARAWSLWYGRAALHLLDHQRCPGGGGV